MAQIINLRHARKQVARKDAEAKADANRLLHSVPASQRKAAKNISNLEEQRHEANRLEPRVSLAQGPTGEN